MRHVTIYTDGACKGNPGPGAYGAVLIHGKHRKEISAAYAMTTNNRMELRAAIAALELLSEPCKVLLHSDSKYLVHAITQHWIDGWQKRNWVASNKKPVKNQDLWRLLIKAIAPHQIDWSWVKGHAGNTENERCDELANLAITAGNHAEDLGFDKDAAGAE